MEKNQIIKIYGTEYKEMTKQLLADADLIGQIPDRGCRIGIKPNLVSPSTADYGATTHTEIVAGIIEYLQEHGCRNLLIAEGSWVGDRTSDAISVCGYDRLAERYGVELRDMQKDGSFVRDCAGLKLSLCNTVKEIDFLINVPVMKGHCQTKMTCALKNMKGLIPNKEKRHFHAMGLHRPIAHLATGIHQDFIVVDHICGDLDFEDGGNPVVRNCIMAARDPVLVDAYVCGLLHYAISEVPYIGLAEQLGAGCADLTKAEIAVLLPQRGTKERRETEGQIPREDEKEEKEQISHKGGKKSEELKSCKGGKKIEEQIARMDGKECEEQNPHRDDKRKGEQLSHWTENGIARRMLCGEEIWDEELPYADKVVAVRDMVEEVESCSACYGYLIPALDRLRAEGLLEQLHEKICIGQGYRGKSGRLGVGSCTSGFQFCVKGCPPTETQIYEALRQYIIAADFTK